MSTPLPGWQGGDSNAAYLDKTLTHHPIELALDESVSGWVLLQLLLRAMLVGLMVGAVPAFVGIVLMVSGAGESSSAFGSSSSAPEGIGWLVFAFVSSEVVFLLVLLFGRFTEPIAEWRVLLHDRRDSAERVYRHIAGVLKQRQSPLRWQPHRIRFAGHGVNHRLRLTDGHYRAYVTVFPYGTSLYLGWTMWRSRRGAVLLYQFLADLLRGALGEGGMENQVMRSERPRAMREAVHLASREGLFVAVDPNSAPIDGFRDRMPPVTDGFIPEPSGPSGPPQPFPPLPSPPTDHGHPPTPPVPTRPAAAPPPPGHAPGGGPAQGPPS